MALANEPPPITVPLKGSKLVRRLLSLFGWRVDIAGLPGPRGILVVYPHTSNLDFFLGILAKSASGVPANFLAKDSLFTLPLVGQWLRYLGGKAVIRDRPQGYVKVLAQEMAQAAFFWLAIAPEGTRKYTPGWRSGFYHLALETNYPVGFVSIDYQSKTIQLKGFLLMTGVQTTDLEKIQQLYAGEVGRYPENMAPIVFWSPTSSNK